MIPFTQDVGIFYATIYGGVIIGVLFDFYRALKFNFKFMRCFSIFFDIIFWIFATLVIFLTINLTEFFDLRYYHFVALIVGFLIYYNTISKYILSFIRKLICFTSNLFKKVVLGLVAFINNLYYVIIYSMHLLFDIIFYIPNIIIGIKRRIDKKSKNTKIKKTMKTDKLAKPKKAKKKEKHKKYNKPKKTKKLKKIGKSKSKSK
nr:spore cortex biosynthesis protein YabQ [Clostridioides sp.]